MRTSRYPAALRAAVEERMRAGATLRELVKECGVEYHTLHRWLGSLRQKGEDVAFIYHSQELRALVFQRLAEGVPVKAIAQEVPMSPGHLYRLRRKYLSLGMAVPPKPKAPPRRDRPLSEVEVENAALRQELKSALATNADLEREGRKLKAALADSVMEATFFAGALQRTEAASHETHGSSATPSTSRSGR
ncbi:MAG: helix-turn-helix domain containing protein [Armatimonadetes bacterium]|nr:helix-turn-helix domain containing protein [Armatimonadota bacterium]